MSIKKRVSKILKTLVFTMEAASRFELENVGFAGRCLTTWPSRQCMERETGVEPATSTLARSHSTTELFPLSKQKEFIYGCRYFVNKKLLKIKTFLP